MYRALDYVNYHTLELNHLKDPREEEEKYVYDMPSLQESCCDVLNDSVSIFLGNSSLLLEAVRSLPLHMVVMLLRVAIDKQQNVAISHIISAWPFPTLW
jgi:hypothetical protein